MLSVARRWIMLILAFLTAFTLHLLLFSYSPLVPEIMSEMGLSHAQAGLIFSMCILTITVFRIPWGILSDRTGFVMAMRLAMILVAAFGLLRGLAGGYEALLALQSLLGIGFAAILPCLPKLVDAYFPRRSGLATGAYVAGFPIGEMVGLSLTPRLLALTGDWRRIFSIFGIWGLILALLWWMVAREPARDDRASAFETRSPPSFKEGFANAVRSKEVWVLTGLCIISMGSYDAIVLWLPTMLEYRGISEGTAGLMASILPLGFLCSGPVVGSASDRAGLRRPFIWALGLVGGLSILAIGLGSGLLLLTGIFLTGLCLTGILTLVLVIPTELVEISGFVGSTVGIVSSFGNIGSLLMPIAIGCVKDATGSFLPAFAMLAAATEMMLILGLVLRETGRARGAGFLPDRTQNRHSNESLEKMQGPPRILGN